MRAGGERNGVLDVLRTEDLVMSQQTIRSSAGVPTGNGRQTLVAHFSSRDDADEARERLLEEGVPDDAVHVYPDVAVEGSSRGVSAYDAARDEGGFWAALAHIFMPDRDRYAYAEGMSRGGATLTVTLDAAHVEQVAGILERHGAVDMEEQQARWRDEGWAGYAAAEGQAEVPADPAAARARVRSFGNA